MKRKRLRKMKRGEKVTCEGGDAEEADSGRGAEW